MRLLIKPKNIPEININKPDLNGYKGNLNIGTIIANQQPIKAFKLDIEDIKRHIIIYGRTGTGKSTFLKHLLLRFQNKYPEIPFLIFEFKGEYDDINEYGIRADILKPGLNFYINIFDHDIFPSQIFAEVLYDSLKSCQILEEKGEFSPQMEKVLIEILQKVCNQKNNSWKDFDRNLDEYMIKYENSIPMLTQTMISIKNRLRRFISGLLSRLFKFDSNETKISTIFEKNVVIDLGHIFQLGGSKEDIIFFANLILKWIWQFNMIKPPSDQLKHVTIFEDVSYIASKKILDQSKLSTYLEDITLLLRGKGEALIYLTTTLEISKNMLLNSGTKFIFKFNEKSDNVYSLFGINDDIDINLLNLGYCLVKTDSLPMIFLLKIHNALKKVNNRKNFQNHKEKKTVKDELKGTMVYETKSNNKVVDRNDNINIQVFFKKLKIKIEDMWKLLFLRREREFDETAYQIMKLLQEKMDLIENNTEISNIYMNEIKKIGQISHQLRIISEKNKNNNPEERIRNFELIIAFWKYGSSFFINHQNDNSNENFERNPSDIHISPIVTESGENYDNYIVYKLIYDISDREQDIFFEYGKNYERNLVEVEKKKIKNVWTEILNNDVIYLIHKIEVNLQLKRKKKIILYSIFSFREKNLRKSPFIEYLNRTYDFLISELFQNQEFSNILCFNKVENDEKISFKERNYFMKNLIRNYVISINKSANKFLLIKEEPNIFNELIKKLMNLNIIISKLFIHNCIKNRTNKHIN